MVMVEVPLTATEMGVAGESTIETGWQALKVSGTEKTPLTLAVIRALPGCTAVARPLASMVTALVFELEKVKAPTFCGVIGVLFVSNAWAVNCSVSVCELHGDAAGWVGGLTAVRVTRAMRGWMATGAVCVMPADATVMVP